MTKQITCPCGGRPSCKLCSGTKSYAYEIGPRGHLPFTCPTCNGAGWLSESGTNRVKCFTCLGNGTVDPADPPNNGFIDIIWKALFGA